MILYVSDIDGTLIDDNEILSEETLSVLRPRIENGMNFTIATGRTLLDSKEYLDKLGIRLPVVLSNGVHVYDPITKKYLEKNYLKKEVASKILNIFDKGDLYPFIITTEKEKYEKIFHKALRGNSMKKIYESRVIQNDNRQELIYSYDLMNDKDIISINIIDKESVLRPIYEKISKKFNVTCYIIEGNGFPGHCWLEIYSPNASKGKGVNRIRNILNARKVISFGDNKNDISMFEASDFSYAVENSSTFIKNMAKGVIGSNNESGVAKFIASKT